MQITRTDLEALAEQEIITTEQAAAIWQALSQRARLEQRMLATLPAWMLQMRPAQHG